MNQITHLIPLLLFLLVSCSRGPHDEYEFIYPCFIDNTHYAYACYYSNVSDGIWGDPSWGESRSFVTIVDIETNDSTVIYDVNIFRNIKYLAVNHAESTITVATRDSLLVYDKAGMHLSSFYSPHAPDFKGWYKPGSQFLAHESYKNINIRNIKNSSDLVSFTAYQGDAQTNKIVLVRDDSLFTYPAGIAYKTPVVSKAVRWVNDSIVAFSGEFKTNIWIYNLNSNATSFITEAYVDMWPTFSISPNLKWVVYAECNFSEDITPIIVKKINDSNQTN